MARNFLIEKDRLLFLHDFVPPVHVPALFIHFAALRDDLILLLLAFLFEGVGLLYDMLGHLLVLTTA